ncbi:MAG TPA: hypothetical protein VJ596_01395 [Gemmatimonadaceae bacterium]|nr:hypothetical protein [Gemmatimonadaceae bacterium]
MPPVQPVHTLYVAADAFTARQAREAGETALAALRDWAPDAETFGRAIGWARGAELLSLVYDRVVQKLEREPVEDLRADFEDGYGTRPEDEEDSAAIAVAQGIAAAARDRSLPRFIGIRVKPLTPELFRRSQRTLELVLRGIVDEAGELPPGLRVTLPKVTTAEQMYRFAELLGALENRLGITAGILRFEMMVETPQSIVDESGAAALPRLVDAAHGRLSAAHYGVYDFTAACGIGPAHQGLAHPLSDFVRQMMIVSLAGRGIWLSDGSTAELPVTTHHVSGRDASAGHEHAVHRAWKRHFDEVSRSLAQGFYQGWDLHPAQLPTRFAAVYAFYLSGLPAASTRLRALLQRASGGGIQDDPATGQALLAFVQRGIACGALSEREVVSATGLVTHELADMSFADVLRGRSR